MEELLLKNNLIANFLGQGWNAFISIALIPLYIKYLGIEAYGLIGVYAMLQAWFTLLDMGMAPTLSREMARYTAGLSDSQYIRTLLRSVEVIAACVALLLFLSVFAGSDWLAKNWLTSDKLSLETIRSAFIAMGCVAALRFIENIYRSSIVGLQRQVILNVVISISATVRSVGAVIVLAWISPTIESFFMWQAFASFLTAISFGVVTYSSIPKTGRSTKFSIDSLRNVWKFAGGMLGISLLAMLLTQTDKLLLSTLLSLKDYGYYSLAAVVASATNSLVGPISQAWSPKLSSLSASNDDIRIRATYHLGSQLVSVLVGSAAVVLIVFSDVIIALWTNDKDLAQRISAIVCLLTFGNLLNCLMWIPYQLQLAYGCTSIMLRINAFCVAVVVPSILLITPKFGMEGAGWVWVCLNAFYLLLGIQIMHQKILVGEKWTWYVFDVFLPLVAAGMVALVARAAYTESANVVFQVFFVATVLFATLAGASMAASSVRNKVQLALSGAISAGISKYAMVRKS